MSRTAAGVEAVTTDLIAGSAGRGRPGVQELTEPSVESSRALLPNARLLQDAEDALQDTPLIISEEL